MTNDRVPNSDDNFDDAQDPTISEEQPGNGPPDSRLADELDVLLRRLGSESTTVVAGVFGNWLELVGDTVAQHASPVKLEAGRLLVEVDEPAWATQMHFLESEIIRKLSTSTGNTISGIDVRVKRSPRTS